MTAHVVGVLGTALLIVVAVLLDSGPQVHRRQPARDRSARK